MAVYTELSFDEIQNFLDPYGLANLKTTSGISAGVENTNYLLTLEGDHKLILTLFEKRVASSDLPFFVGLMEQLARKSLPVPRPLHTEDAKIIGSIKDKPAIVITFLEGKSTNTIKTEHVAELGKYLAKMHLGSTGYHGIRPNALSLSGWREITAKVLARAEEITEGLAQDLQEEIAYLESEWPEDLPQGVIHADLFPDNVFYNAQNQLTGIIDFYFACNDFLAYDIAVCLNAWCFEKDLQFNITKARSLLNSYHGLRPLSAGELRALPVLARGAALRFLLTRTYDWLFPVKNALVTPKNPLEYLSKLSFHRKVRSHTEYGL
jgi:homoserine kinase type II